MRRLALASSIVFAALACCSQLAAVPSHAEQRVIWARTTPVAESTYSEVSSLDADEHRTYVASTQQSPVGNGQTFVQIQAFDDNGHRLWSHTITADQVAANSLVVDNNTHEVFLAATEESSAGTIAVLFDINPHSGQVRFGEKLGSVSGGVAAAIDASRGIVYLTAARNNAYAIFAVSQYGEPDWVRTLEQPKDSEGCAPAGITADTKRHHVAVTGMCSTPFGVYETVDYSFRGTRLWTKQVSEVEDNLTPSSVAVNPHNGHIDVSGLKFSGTYAWLTVDYTSGGHQAWIRKYVSGHNAASAVTDVAVDSSNGDIYVSGSQVADTYGEGVLVDYQPSGRPVWLRRQRVIWTNDGSPISARVFPAFDAVNSHDHAATMTADGPYLQDAPIVTFGLTGHREWSATLGDQAEPSALDEDNAKTRLVVSGIGDQSSLRTVAFAD